jgi:hypothetical protein
MNAPYPVFTMGADPAVPVLTFGLLALVALVRCAVIARRERRVWPLAVFGGSALLVTYEPMNNFLLHAAYPENGWRMLGWLGQNVPWSTWLIYMFYFSFPVTMLMIRLERGMTTASFWKFFAGTTFFAAVFEPAFTYPSGLDWWVYYGEDQPLNFTGLPVFWWFADGMILVGVGVLLHLVRRHLLTRDWQSLVFVPLMPLLLFGVHGSATAPVAVAILERAPNAAITACSLLGIAISLLYTALFARAARVSNARSGLPEDRDGSGSDRGSLAVAGPSGR